jgi:acetyl-CoA synthetase
MSEALSNLGSENRTFAPTEAFASQANAKQEIYERADKDYLAFWEEANCELRI